MPFEVAATKFRAQRGNCLNSTAVRAFLAISASKWVAIRDEAASVQIKYFS